MEETIIADGVTLRVRVSGDGPDLLLVNGLGAPMSGWKPLDSWLAGRRVVRFDAPGVGESPTPPRPVSVSRLASAVAAAMTVVGVTRTDVLGMSMGGAVAQELARLEPHRVRRLVLVSSTCGWGGVPLNPLSVLALARVDRFRNVRIYGRLAPWLIGGRTAADPKALRRYLDARTAEPPDQLGYLWQLLAAGFWTSVPWLHTLQQPTLVMLGDADPLLSVWTARLMAARLPAGRLCLIRGGGHLVLFDSPEIAMPTIQRFLEFPS